MAGLLNVDAGGDGKQVADDQSGNDGQQQHGQEGQQGDPNAQQQAPERPEYLPAEAFGDKGYDPALHLTHLRSTRRPEAADKYALPEIEGFDKDAAGASPLFAALRTAAFDTGLDQTEFDAVVANYVKGESERASAAQAAEIAKLGDNATQRLQTINTFLGANLPTEQAAALAATATTAAAVIAIEALITKIGGGRQQDGGGGGGGGAARKSRAEIEAVMQTPAYRGKSNERDPAVVAEVDKWFAEEAKINPRKGRG